MATRDPFRRVAGTAPGRAGACHVDPNASREATPLLETSGSDRAGRSVASSTCIRRAVVRPIRAGSYTCLRIASPPLSHGHPAQAFDWAPRSAIKSAFSQNQRFTSRSSVGECSFLFTNALALANTVGYYSPYGEITTTAERQAYSTLSPVTYCGDQLHHAETRDYPACRPRGW